MGAWVIGMWVARHHPSEAGSVQQPAGANTLHLPMHMRGSNTGGSAGSSSAATCSSRVQGDGELRLRARLAGLDTARFDRRAADGVDLRLLHLVNQVAVSNAAGIEGAGGGEAAAVQQAAKAPPGWRAHFQGAGGPDQRNTGRWANAVGEVATIGALGGGTGSTACVRWCACYLQGSQGLPWTANGGCALRHQRIVGVGSHRGRAAGRRRDARPVGRWRNLLTEAMYPLEATGGYRRASRAPAPALGGTHGALSVVAVATLDSGVVAGAGLTTDPAQETLQWKQWVGGWVGGVWSARAHTPPCKAMRRVQAGQAAAGCDRSPLVTSCPAERRWHTPGLLCGRQSALANPSPAHLYCVSISRLPSKHSI